MKNLFQDLIQCIGGARVFTTFRVADDGMVGNIGQGQSNESVVSVSVCSVDVVIVVDGVDSLGGTSLFHGFLEHFT